MESGGPSEYNVDVIFRRKGVISMRRVVSHQWYSEVAADFCSGKDAAAENRASQNSAAHEKPVQNPFSRCPSRLRVLWGNLLRAEDAGLRAAHQRLPAVWARAPHSPFL